MSELLGKGSGLAVVLFLAVFLAGGGQKPAPRPSPWKPRPGPKPGPGPYPSPSGGLGRTVYPVRDPSTLVSRYGPGRPGKWHWGVDIGAPAGSDALACVDGTVTYGTDPKGGNVAVVTSSADGAAYYYAHLQDVVGQGFSSLASRSVSAGDVIASVGNTGNAVTTGPHVHFEFWPTGHYMPEPPDPTPFLQTAQHLKGASV